MRMFLRRYIFILFSLVILSCSQGENYPGKGPWTIVGRMNVPRMAFAAIAVGENIYVIGGTNDRGYISDCEWVKVSPDGAVTNWKKVYSLTAPRGFVAVASYNGYVYAIGGANGEHGSNLLNTIERAKINPDGSLGRWELEKNTMFSSRRGGTAFAANGYIFAIGGYNGEFLDTVEKAKINPDGSLGKWELMIPTLQDRRYIHSSIYTGGYIYVMGGHDRGSGGALNSVEYAKVKNDGGLEEFVKALPSIGARYGAGVVVMNDFIYLIGGYDGRAINSVERAALNPYGAINVWESVSSLSIPRNSPGIVAYKNNIYVIGGSDDKGRYLSSIEAVKINDKNEIRSWKR
ncbi:MAG TPA: hypothetical protein DCL42_03975 [Deltaproteobacteria bacterium]|nr:hypothetical protein [Deltaproteobacteria bacterium]